jgi:hypothetical protein
MRLYDDCQLKPILILQSIWVFIMGYPLSILIKFILVHDKKGMLIIFASTNEVRAKRHLPFLSCTKQIYTIFSKLVQNSRLSNI